MECAKCQHQNPPQSKFCLECGERLEPACPSCGTRLPAGAKFCNECGHALSKPAAAPKVIAPPQPPPSSAPGGERRQATVLFSDLSGYTALNEQLDPEEVAAIMARFKAEAVKIVEDHGGIVNQFVGDEIFALFGIPTAHEDDPVRAVRAAVTLHGMVRELSPEVEARLHRTLRLHSGINTGLIVTTLSDDRDGRVNVTGDTINTGSRLRSLAEDDNILVGPETRKRVADYFETEALAPASLKGKEGTVTPFRIAAERATPVKASQPLIGRRAELRQFTGIVAECLESGRGQGIYVRGHTGFGKSRLVEEFQTVASAQGFACHVGLVLDFGVAKGHDAIRTVVSSLLGISTGAADDLRREAAGRAVAAGTVDEAQAPFLNDLLDLPQPAELRSIYDAMDNESRDRGKRETVCGLLRRISATQPVMVTIEDIHWADGTTRASLAAVAATAAEARALLVMTSRREGDPLDEAWRGASRGSPLTTIDVGALHPEEAQEMARQFRNINPGFAERCIERAAGNPFHLMELLRAAEESSEETVPGSVQSLVLERIDHLDAADREALCAASIFGRRFPLDAQRALLGKPNYRCDELVARSFVMPEGEAYLFAHALVQEVVYSSLLKARRHEMHRRAADWFAGDLPLRAEHLDRAEDPEAPQAYLDAARDQAAQYRYERALRLAQRGLELAAEPAQKFTLNCYVGEMLRNLGRNPEAVEAYRQAEQSASYDIQRCQAWIGQAEGMRVIDQIQDALVMVDKAEQPATENHLSLELAQLHHLRGNLLFPRGDIDGCVREHEAALKHAREAGSQEAEASALGGLCDAYYVRGRMATAHNYARRCIELARVHGFRRIEVENLPMVGWTVYFQNELEQTREIGLTAAVIAAEVSHQRAEMLARMLVCFVQSEFVGDYAEAVEYANQTIDLIRKLKARRFEPSGLASLTKSALAAGDRFTALKLAKQAVEISRETGMSFQGPRHLGILALVTDSPEERQRALAEGESILREGCVGHNYFWFYRDAMEVCLNTGDWDSVERYAAALDEYTRPEPLPWSEFFIARARALAALGRGRRDDELIAALRALHEKAQRVGFNTDLRAIDDALNAAKAPRGGKEARPL